MSRVDHILAALAECGPDTTILSVERLEPVQSLGAQLYQRAWSEQWSLLDLLEHVDPERAVRKTKRSARRETPPKPARPNGRVSLRARERTRQDAENDASRVTAARRR